MEVLEPSTVKIIASSDVIFYEATGHSPSLLSKTQITIVDVPYSLL